MTMLGDVLDVDLLRRHVQNGLVREVRHPEDGDLRLYNYTPKAVASDWDATLRECRGLIVRGSEIVARPFAKFFNVEEPYSQWVFDNLQEACLAVEKMDGSLGIMYVAPDGLPAIATRGSFTSEQAVHATEVLRTRYMDWATKEIDQGCTFMFEIVYPENRIVVDNGSLDDLVYLGNRWLDDGATFASIDAATVFGWPGPVAPIVHECLVAEALAIPATGGREGLVLYVSTFGTGYRLVKVKEPWYVEAHRVVTGLDERVVWRHISGFKDGHFGDPGRLSELTDQLDAEHREWAERVAADLWQRFDRIENKVHLACGRAARQSADLYGETYSRAEFIQQAKLGSWFHEVAAFSQGKDIGPMIWRLLKPAANRRAGSPVVSA